MFSDSHCDAGRALVARIRVADATTPAVADVATALDAVARLNAQNGALLRTACRVSRLDIAQLLIDRGACVNIPRVDLLEEAVTCSSVDVIECLLKNGVIVHSEEACLETAVESDRVDAFKNLFVKWRWTPSTLVRHAVLYEGRLILEYLVREHGALREHSSHFGSTTHLPTAVHSRLPTEWVDTVRNLYKECAPEKLFSEASVRSDIQTLVRNETQWTWHPTYSVANVAAILQDRWDYVRGETLALLFQFRKPVFQALVIDAGRHVSHSDLNVALELCCEFTNNRAMHTLIGLGAKAGPKSVETAVLQRNVEALELCLANLQPGFKVTSAIRKAVKSTNYAPCFEALRRYEEASAAGAAEAARRRETPAPTGCVFGWWRRPVRAIEA